MSLGGVTPVMVGRGAQLAALHGILDCVCAGSPAVVLVGGEAGAGKSRLITEFAASVADRAVLLRGGCVELGGAGLAFAPFTAALRGLVRRYGAERVAALVPGGAPVELGRLLPALGQPDPDPGLGDADTTLARLFEELLGLLESLADQQPVVLVVEDAHWADRSSRELLAFLARNLQPATALLIVVSYRTDDLTAGHPTRLLLAELERLPPVTRLELPRLSRAEVITQIRAILGGPGPAGLAEEVVSRADGNPMFVEALLSSGGRLPESLRDLLLAGVRRLPDRTQDLLGAAAVAGAEFGEELLEAVTGVDGEVLTGGLRPAVAAGVLVTGDDGFVFRHALIREATQAGLLPGERRRWHRELANVLEARPDLAPGGRAAAQVAYHWHAAGEPERALPAAWKAAAEAAATLAYAEQLVVLDQVLTLWDTFPDAARLAGTSRLEVLEQAATAAHLAGRPEHGVRLSDAALAEPGIRDDPVRAFLFTAQRTAMSLQLRRPELAGLYRAAAAVAEDDPARPRVLAALAEQLMDAQLPEEAYEQSKRALAAARRAGDRITEASALVTVAALAARKGDMAAQLPQLAEARDIAERTGVPTLLLRALNWEAVVLEANGEHERAAQAARRGIAAAAAAGLARTSGVVHTVTLVEALTALGRWDEAVEVTERALSLLPPAGPRLLLLQLGGSIALARGDFAAAAAALGEARAQAPAPGVSFGTYEELMLAELEVALQAAQGDIAGALATARRALTIEGSRAAGLKRYLRPLLATAAEVACTALAPGRPHDLAELAGGVLQLAATHAAALQPVSPAGRAYQATYRAAADQAAGQSANHAWDEAAAAWERLSEPYRQARALLYAAEAALAGDGNRDAAADRLRRAAGLADALDARPLREQISSLAARARISITEGTAPDHTGDATPALPGLTSRELEVLRLVAAGRSNRDIAAELFISAKTASVHVSNILAKLGVHTRVEAAAIAHRTGLTGPA